MRIIQAPKNYHFDGLTFWNGEFVSALNPRLSRLSHGISFGDKFFFSEEMTTRHYASRRFIPTLGPVLHVELDLWEDDEVGYNPPPDRGILDTTGAVYNNRDHKKWFTKSMRQKWKWWGDNADASSDGHYVCCGCDYRDGGYVANDWLDMVAGPSAWERANASLKGERSSKKARRLIYVYNRSSRDVQTFDLGFEPYGVLISDDGLTLGVQGERQITIIDLET